MFAITYGLADRARLNISPAFRVRVWLREATDCTVFSLRLSTMPSIPEDLDVFRVPHVHMTKLVHDIEKEVSPSMDDEYDSKFL